MQYIWFQSKRAACALACLAAASVAPSCSEDDGMGPQVIAPSTAVPPTASPIAGAPGAMVPVGSVATAGAPSVGPTTTGTAGSPSMPLNPAVAGSAAMGSAGTAAHGHTAGTMGMAMNPAMQHCIIQPKPDPRDDMLTGEPRELAVGASRDLLVPELVEAWMDENEFAESHDAWHLVRKWDQGCRRSNATGEGCSAARRLMQQKLERAPIQQGAPGDGLAFMMMHRHMIQMLKATFPKHATLFDGFKKVPRTTNDPENPTPWRTLNWSSDNVAGFDILENIEKNVGMFKDEDDLGTYIQNTYVWTAQQPISSVNRQGDGLHGALHAQWAVSGSPANLIQQAVDVKNHIFWKLHGWIDDVWERYRVAKGLKNDDPAYQKLLLEQCMEMHMLMPKNRGMTTSPGGPVDGGPATPETGVFAQTVRPIFENTCAGCHSGMGPSAGLVLGGAGVSSAEVHEGLIGTMSTNGEYPLVEPGNPARSWVYLKASGESAAASCSGSCDREKMPPSGSGLDPAALMTLKQWIMNGAPP